MWRTRLYAEENDLSDDYKRAKIKGFFIRLFACVMLFGSVAVTQLLSNVNLSQQGATDQAAYLKTVLDQEASRAAQITDEFDKMYKSRVEMAAMVLSEKPELIDADSLYRLDQALGGKTLRIFNVDGSVLASDEVLMLAVDDRFYGNSVVYDFNESGGTEMRQDLQNRYYRTFMTDQYGKTTGFVELTVS